MVGRKFIFISLMLSLLLIGLISAATMVRVNDQGNLVTRSPPVLAAPEDRPANSEGAIPDDTVPDDTVPDDTKKSSIAIIIISSIAGIIIIIIIIIFLIKKKKTINYLNPTTPIK